MGRALQPLALPPGVRGQRARAAPCRRWRWFRLRHPAPRRVAPRVPPRGLISAAPARTHATVVALCNGPARSPSPRVSGRCRTIHFARFNALRKSRPWYRRRRQPESGSDCVFGRDTGARDHLDHGGYRQLSQSLSIRAHDRIRYSSSTGVNLDPRNFGSRAMTRNTRLETIVDRTPKSLSSKFSAICAGP